MTVTFIIIGAVVLLAIIAVAIYNGLVTSKVRVEEAWSDITVQLKRRYDLIPNLVNTVKGYAKHEREVFQNVTEARTKAMNAEGVQEQAQAENQFQTALKSLFAVSENYPDLKANQNFQDLQAELVDTEDKIQAARRFYNGAARDFNIKTKTFPTLLFAGALGFHEKEFFEVDDAETAAISKPTDVKFE
jgi:LemA protein